MRSMTVTDILVFFPPVFTRSIEEWTKHLTPTELERFNQVIVEAWNEPVPAVIGNRMIDVIEAIRRINLEHANHLATVFTDVITLAEQLSLWLEVEDMLVLMRCRISDVMMMNGGR